MGATPLPQHKPADGVGRRLRAHSHSNLGWNLVRAMAGRYCWPPGASEWPPAGAVGVSPPSRQQGRWRFRARMEALDRALGGGHCLHRGRPWEPLDRRDGRWQQGRRMCVGGGWRVGRLAAVGGGWACLAADQGGRAARASCARRSHPPRRRRHRERRLAAVTRRRCKEPKRLRRRSRRPTRDIPRPRFASEASRATRRAARCGQQARPTGGVEEPVVRHSLPRGDGGGGGRRPYRATDAWPAAGSGPPSRGAAASRPAASRGWRRT